MSAASDPRRALPSVDALLTREAGAALVARFGRAPALDAVRATLEAVRARVVEDEGSVPDADTILGLARDELEASFRPTLRAVVNATGVILHTNLGRAPLSEAAQRAMVEAAAGYSTVEYDLDTGERGSRAVHAEALLRRVTGAEAALVVNNNAAAVLLALSALAAGREVVIARGQLIEIGGGFRVPDVLAQSGARLVEVGTTNRTRAGDYAAAITDATALLLRAHPSNFRIVGFVEETSLADMARVAHARGLLLVDDLGSGALLDTAAYGLAHEPTVQESLEAGADLVCFSGDKLLGGPQSGVLVGRQDLVDRARRHPLARAARADKLCLAALSATLLHYARGEAVEAIPVWRMIAQSYSDVRAQAAAWAAATGGTVVDGESTVGGGSLPGATLPTALLALDVARPDAAAARLRRASTPVIARVADGCLLLDPRTVLPGQESALLAAVRALVE